MYIGMRGYGAVEGKLMGVGRMEGDREGWRGWKEAFNYLYGFRWTEMASSKYVSVV